MADVLISATPEDQTTAERLGQLITSRGYSVDWLTLDPAENGYKSAIISRRVAARATIALWSSHSAHNQVVRDDASEALRRGTLIIAKLDQTSLAPEFAAGRTVTLANWTGGEDHIETGRLLSELTKILTRTSTRPALAMAAARLMRTGGGYAYPVSTPFAASDATQGNGYATGAVAQGSGGGNSTTGDRGDASVISSGPSGVGLGAPRPEMNGGAAKDDRANAPTAANDSIASPPVTPVSSPADAVPAKVSIQPTPVRATAPSTPTPVPVSPAAVANAPVTQVSSQPVAPKASTQAPAADALPVTQPPATSETKAPSSNALVVSAPAQYGLPLPRIFVPMLPSVFTQADALAASLKPVVKSSTAELPSAVPQENVTASEANPDAAPVASVISSDAINEEVLVEKPIASATEPGKRDQNPSLDAVSAATEKDPSAIIDAAALKTSSRALSDNTDTKSGPLTAKVGRAAPITSLSDSAIINGAAKDVASTQIVKSERHELSKPTTPPVDDAAIQARTIQARDAAQTAPKQIPPRINREVRIERAPATKRPIFRERSVRTEKDDLRQTMALGAGVAAGALFLAFWFNNRPYEFSPTQDVADVSQSGKIGTTGPIEVQTAPIAPIDADVDVPVQAANPTDMAMGDTIDDQGFARGVAPHAAKPSDVMPSPAAPQIAIAPVRPEPAMGAVTPPTPSSVASAPPRQDKLAAVQPRLTAPVEKPITKPTAPSDAQKQVGGDIAARPQLASPSQTLQSNVARAKLAPPSTVSEKPARSAPKAFAHAAPRHASGRKSGAITLASTKSGYARKNPLSASVAPFELAASTTLLQIRSDQAPFHLPGLAPTMIAAWQPSIDTLPPVMAAPVSDEAWNTAPANSLAQTAATDGTYAEYLADARAGSVRSMLILGLMRQNGIGADQSDEIAVAWLRRAAQNGDPRAMAELGYYYASGRGVDQDDAHAGRLFARSAALGAPAGKTALGWAMATGRGAPVNLEEARRLFEEAANSGDVLAALNLGRFYADGIGGSRDVDQAIKWYGVSADTGFAPAQYGLAMMLMQSPQSPTALEANAGVETQGNAQLLSPVRLQQAAAQGYPEAVRLLNALGPDSTLTAPSLNQTWLGRVRKGGWISAIRLAAFTSMKNPIR